MNSSDRYKAEKQLTKTQTRRGRVFIYPNNKKIQYTDPRVLVMSDS